MSVWNDNENIYDKYIIEYWGHSPIEWQQKNREILNESIKIYNEYVLGKATLDKVKTTIYYAESRLKNECGDYMYDIELMKKNVDEIELNKE